MIKALFILTENVVSFVDYEIKHTLLLDKFVLKTPAVSWTEKTESHLLPNVSTKD